MARPGSLDGRGTEAVEFGLGSLGSCTEVGAGVVERPAPGIIPGSQFLALAGSLLADGQHLCLGVGPRVVSPGIGRVGAALGGCGPILTANCLLPGLLGERLSG